MPSQGKRLCARCRRIIPAGPCPHCASKRDAAPRTETVAERGYGSRWRRIRRDFLVDNPLCCLCQAEGRLVMAEVADHYPKSRRELIELGTDPDDPEHLRPLCASCHSRETAKRQPPGSARRGAF